MKNILFSIAIVLMSVNMAFSPSICEAIEFHSDTILIQAPTDESINIKFNYDWETNPSVADPGPPGNQTGAFTQRHLFLDDY